MLSDDIERDTCWFQRCESEPEGHLHDGDGFAPPVCEHHGKMASELPAWDQYIFAGEARSEGGDG
jgi:hypothetical protein